MRNYSVIILKYSKMQNVTVKVWNFRSSVYTSFICRCQSTRCTQYRFFFFHKCRQKLQNASCMIVTSFVYTYLKNGSWQCDKNIKWDNWSVLGFTIIRCDISDVARVIFESWRSLILVRNTAAFNAPILDIVYITWR